MGVFQKYKIQIIYAVLFVFTVLFVFVNNHYTYFWFDEGFTISIIKHPYSAIWSLTAGDVHPPLYYLLLKTYASLVGDSVSCLRFFSAIPIFLTVIVASTLIRKLWGDKVAIVFIIAMFFSSLVPYMTSEIRMYSWAAFFVLMTFLFAYMSYTCKQKKYIILFVLFSLFAAYTHYYALITVAYIYLLYFLIVLIKDKKQIINVVLAGVVFALGYLPWLLIFMTQLKSVSEDYWILSFDPIATFFDSINAFSSLEKTNLFYMHNRFVENGVFVLLMLLLFVNLFKKGSRKVIVEILLIYSIFIFPIALGIGYSALVKPIFVDRYLSCFIFIFFLVFAILVSYVDFSKKKNIVLSVLFILFFAALSGVEFSHKMRLARLQTIGLNSISLFVNENRDNNTVFLYRDSIFYPMAIYPNLFPDNMHISRADSLSSKDRAVVNVFNPVRIDSYAEIDSVYKQIYILDHFPAIGPKNLLNVKKDSLELDENFEIVRKVNINDFEIYELRRRTKDTK